MALATIARLSANGAAGHAIEYPGGVVSALSMAECMTLCNISMEGELPVPIDLAESQHQALLKGWDETEQILQAGGARIAAFEAAQRTGQPWLYTWEEE